MVRTPQYAFHAWECIHLFSYSFRPFSTLAQLSQLFLRYVWWLRVSVYAIAAPAALATRSLSLFIHFALSARVCICCVRIKHTSLSLVRLLVCIVQNRINGDVASNERLNDRPNKNNDYSKYCCCIAFFASLFICLFVLPFSPVLLA